MLRTHHHARRVLWCVLAFSALAQPTHPLLNLIGFRVLPYLEAARIKKSHSPDSQANLEFQMMKSVCALSFWPGGQRAEIKYVNTRPS